MHCCVHRRSVPQQSASLGWCRLCQRRSKPFAAERVHECKQCMGAPPQTCRIPIGQSRFDQAIACVCDWCFFHWGPVAVVRACRLGPCRHVQQGADYLAGSFDGRQPCISRELGTQQHTMCTGAQALTTASHFGALMSGHCIAAFHLQQAAAASQGAAMHAAPSAHRGIALGVLVGGILPSLGQQAVVPAQAKVAQTGMRAGGRRGSAGQQQQRRQRHQRQRQRWRQGQRQGQQRSEQWKQQSMAASGRAHQLML